MRLIFLLLIFLPLVKSQDIFATTNSAGNIKGRIRNINGKNYGVFLGIPYAKPPVDNLRFKDPEPLEPISATTIVDASKNFSKTCVQVVYSAADQSEDCLYLNVMSPKTQATDASRYPVMVFIHGGAFILGSASQYQVDGPLRNIVSRGVVLVTINYRLGIFGFFTTKSSAAPGNYAMMDQVQALKWVQKNIEYFGGDPRRVTIFGESAGGGSVSLLTISPVTKGLFCQAIIMSGSALAPWALMYDADPNDPSGKLLESTGCRTTSRSQTTTNTSCPLRLQPSTPPPSASELAEQEKEVQCLRSKFNEIVSQKSIPFVAPMRPRIDGKFLPNSPEILIKNRPAYNLLLGADNDEFSVFEFAPFPGFGNGLVLTKEKFYSDSFGISCTNYKNPSLVNSTAHSKYANSPPFASSGMDERHYWFKQDYQPQSAQMFFVPVYNDAVEATRTGSKVYLYSWEYKDAEELYDNTTDFYWKGASHGSELYYLFDTEIIGFSSHVNPSRRDKTHDSRAKQVLGDLWTNFAKYGTPTPNTNFGGVQWKEMNERDGNYMSLEIPCIQMKNKFYNDDVQFWNSQIPQLDG